MRKFTPAQKRLKPKRDKFIPQGLNRLREPTSLYPQRPALSEGSVFLSSKKTRISNCLPVHQPFQAAEAAEYRLFRRFPALNRRDAWSSASLSGPENPATKHPGGKKICPGRIFFLTSREKWIILLPKFTQTRSGKENFHAEHLYDNLSHHLSGGGRRAGWDRSALEQPAFPCS